MDIIMPVAGLGSRLRPQTWSKPKPLVSVAGKPMLAHTLDRLMPLNPSKLVFITGYLGDQIEAWARANYDIDMVFVEQPEMLGQTDAIIRTRGHCHDDALILFPDMSFEADFTGLREVDADAVMFTKEVEDPSALGIALVENGRIVKLIEKPQEPISNLAVIGIYYVKQINDLYEAIDEQFERKIMLKNEYFIADAMQLMIDNGKKIVTMPVSVWEDAGNAVTLLDTNRSMLDRMNQPTPQREGSVIIHPCAIAADAVIEGSVVGPHVSLGSRAVIRNSVVSDSVIEDNAQIESAIIGGSVIGRKAVVRGRANRMNVGDNSSVDC